MEIMLIDKGQDESGHRYLFWGISTFFKVLLLSPMQGKKKKMTLDGYYDNSNIS